MSLLFFYMADFNFENISVKVLNRERITVEEGNWLAEHSNIAQLGNLAHAVNQFNNGDRVYFNRNIHIEPTNICINHCLFCSYRRRQGQEGSWEYSIDQMLDLAHQAKETDPLLTEFHIVGGVHPDRGLSFYLQLIEKLHQAFPDIHIKAFTAEEIVQMCKLEHIDLNEGLKKLHDKGLMSMPGGGAEIFDASIRRKICPDKITGDQWLHVHETAHKMGIPTNATMLYGHYDTMQHRINHLDQLRTLQDKTGMFNAFIPLKFKSGNNKMSHLGEVSIIEDIKTFALTRIFLDNIPHLKAYWPMLGIDQTLLLLHFGVDDIDGTIADTTKIYSMAGGKERPSLSSKQLVNYIRENQRTPIERDSVYNPIKIYS